MENKNIIRIGVRRTGKLNKRTTIQNRLFHLINGKEIKLKPAEENDDMVYYDLLKKERYRQEEDMSKNGRRLLGKSLLKVEADKVKIERWKGNFCPKFTEC